MNGDQLTGVEEALRQIAPKIEAESQPIRSAIQWLRKVGNYQQFALTQARLAATYGWNAAARVAAPVVKYAGLSEEQMKAVRELEKARESGPPRQEARQIKFSSGGYGPSPYEGARGRKHIGMCNICGMEGHWGRDNQCRVVDIQAKLRREAMGGDSTGGTPIMSMEGPQSYGGPFSYGYGSGAGPGFRYRHGGYGLGMPMAGSAAYTQGGSGGATAMPVISQLPLRQQPGLGQASDWEWSGHSQRGRPAAPTWYQSGGELTRTRLVSS
jgi:hypothetical protein